MKNSTILFGLAALSVVSLSAKSDTLYSNLSQYDGIFQAEGSQVGDEIILNDNGTGSVLTNFVFNVAVQTDEDIFVAIYDQSGVGGSPGGLLWSDTFNSSLLGSGGYTNGVVEDLSSLPGGGLSVPSTFTWTIQLSGVGGPLRVTNAPAISGGHYNDYWLNKGTVGSPNWQLYVDPSVQTVNFAADFSGTANPPAPTPEPASMALLGLGCLVTGSFAKRFKKSA